MSNVCYTNGSLKIFLLCVTNEMKFNSLTIMWLSFVTPGLCRGPHHPHGQLPVRRQHHHYRPKPDEPLTKQTGLLQDISHLEEESESMTAEKLAKMSPEELEFYYFLAHDFDKNSLLDGLELLKAVYHTVHHDDPKVGEGDESNGNEIESVSNDLESFIAIVDSTLLSDDTNNDGFLSYPEYRAARANRTAATFSPVVVAPEGSKQELLILKEPLSNS